jgi:hypothetical protein
MSSSSFHFLHFIRLALPDGYRIQTPEDVDGDYKVILMSDQKTVVARFKLNGLTLDFRYYPELRESMKFQHFFEKSRK